MTSPLLSKDQAQDEQIRLFGEAAPMINKEMVAFRRLYSAVDRLYQNGFNPKDNFDFPDYGGLGRLSLFLSSEAVDAIQQSLPLIARIENPTRDQWLSLILSRAAELGDFPLYDKNTPSPPSPSSLSHKP